MRLTFAALLLAVCINTSAQYSAFPDSSAFWDQTEWWVWWPGPCPVNDQNDLWINGDTVIGAFTYHKLYQTGFVSSICPPPGYSYSVYKGGIRQDTALKQVYYAEPNVSGYHLLYDFNLNVGDTLPVSFGLGEQNIVIGIDSVLVGMNYHKRFLLSSIFQPSPADTTYALIEGVGFTYGLLNPMIPWFEGGSQLNCFWHNGDTYPANSNCQLSIDIDEIAETEFAIYPNPASDKVFISSDFSGGESRYFICNGSGQRVAEGPIEAEMMSISLTDLPEGVYFIQVFNSDSIVTRKLIVAH